MKHLVFIFNCVIAMLLLSKVTQATVLDAPHNSTNDITCTTCHTYSLWWEYSPSSKNQAPGYTAIVNGICIKCHGANSTLPIATHSSAVIGSENNYHNGWGLGCTDCHNPHFQDQINWGAEAYLITGTIDLDKPNKGITTGKVTINSVEYDQTSIAILSPLTKDNENWPVDTWAKKNNTTPDRGLILALDTTKRSNTYSVLSATPSEILVKGEIDPDTIIPGFDPDGNGPLSKNSTTANSFGLIYGQLIKKSVTIPYSIPSQSSSVKFFTPIGGFVDTTNTPATGVCQVCHTLTTSSANNMARFRNDGAAPDSTDSHAYYMTDTEPGGTSTCTMCHSHTMGFKGSGHSPNDFGWSEISYTKADGNVEIVICSDCHANSKGIVEGVHHNKCGLCHINTGGGGPLKVAGGASGTGVDPTNGIDADPSGEYHTPSHTYSATCADCHDKVRKPNLPNTLPQIHHDTPSNYAADGLCTTCHKSASMAATPATRAADHSTKIVTALTSGTHPNIVNGCEECHKFDASTSTDYSTNGTAVGAIIDDGFDNPRVHDSCTSCHTTAGGLKDSSQVTNAIRMVAGYAPGHGTGNTPNLDDGPNNCISCHGADPGIIHLNVNHANTVGNTPQCNWCHYKQVGMSNGATVNPNDSMVHAACTTCHTISKGIAKDYMIGLINPANLTRNLVGQMVTPQSKGGAAVNCTDCHSIHLFADHRKANHTNVVALSTQGCTATCHTATAGRPDPDYGMPVNPVDNKIHDACTSCHNTTSGELRTVVEVNLPYVVAMPNGPIVNGNNQPNDGGGECSACHGTNYFTNHTHNHGVALHASDLAQTAPGTSCSVCHNDAGTNLSTWSAILTEHGGNCSTCHAATRLTGNPSNPAETVQDVIAAHGSATACTTCHWSKKTPAIHGHVSSDFTWGGTCSTCHSGTDVITDVHGRKCALCHTNPSAGNYSRRAGTDGDATLAGLSKTASCLVCHDSSIYPPGGIHHDTNTAVTNNCVTCHGPGVSGMTGANPPDHSITVVVTGTSCSTCHPATAGTAAGIAVSYSDTMLHASCLTCHTFDANKRGILTNFTNKKGVNGSGTLPNNGTIGGKDGGGVCTVCHTVAATTSMATLGTLHHDSPRAAVGQCEYCHADPMPNWNPNAPGDNGTLSGLSPAWPTQMACRECHVAFTDTAMSVTKFTRSDYANYASPWTRTTAHTFPVNGRSINNYGICLGCHFVGSTKVPLSAQVTIWHARPDKHGGSSGWTFYNQSSSGYFGKTNYRSTCNGDQAHYTPGRSGSGIGGFNIFAPNYGRYKNPLGLDYAFENEGNDSSNYCVDYDTFGAPATGAPFTMITLPALPQLGSTAPQDVPVFASITPRMATPPVADDIKVLSAKWNGTNLYAIATTTNTSGCSTLTATYNGIDQTFTGITTCVATFPPSVIYTGSVPTLKVSTSNSLGVSVNGYRISAGLSTGPDTTPPIASEILALPATTTYVPATFSLSTDFIDNESAVSNCEYTTNGTTWQSGTVSGMIPLYTCTANPSTMSGPLTLSMRAISTGGVRTATALTRTVDATAPTDGALTVTAGKNQNVLSWLVAIDTGSGLRTANTYDVRFQTGATPPSCTSGTSVYTGTARTFAHNNLTSTIQYSYRVCAYDNVNNLSTGVTGSATPWASTITAGPTAVIANQMLLLHMDEASWNGTPNEVKDSSGSNHDGTASSATTVPSGITGRAGSFDGTMSTVGMNYSPPMDTFTMECWIKPAATHEIDGESNVGTGGTGGEKYVFWPNHGGDFDGGAGISAGTNGVSVYEHGSSYMPALAVYSGTISSSQWTHIAVVYANKQPSLYINGVLVRTGLQSPRQHVYAPTIIGGEIYGHFQGMIDEVAIYNNALSATDILHHYQQNSAAACLPSEVNISWTTDLDATSYVDYGATSTYGSTAGNSTLVKNHSVQLSGLSAPATYHYRVRSSNLDGDTISGDFTFTLNENPCPSLPPTLANPTATAISTTMATLGANVVSDGGAAISARGTVWGTSTNPTANILAEGGASNGVFAQSRAGLTAGTKIYYRGYATNSIGTEYSPDGSFYTEPTTQVSGVNFTAVGSTGMTVNWTRGNGDGVLVLMRQGAAVTTDPADGTYTAYSASPAFGSGTLIGTGNYVVYRGSGTSVVVSGLSASTAYYVAVYEYKGTVDTSGVDQGTNYKIPATTGTQTSTSSASKPTLTAPTATSIGSSLVTLGANVTSNGGAAITTRGTIWGTSPNPTTNVLADGGTATGSYIQVRTGLPVATKIFYRGYATNSAGTGYSPDGSFYTEPSTQAAALSFSSVNATGMTVNWTRGNGDGVIVLMRQGSAVTTDPADGTFSAYSANPAFGSGTQIGSGNYVVYKGAGANVTVTGLTAGATYYVAAYEYKGSTDTAGVDQGTNYRPYPITSSQATSATGGAYSYTFIYTGSVQTLTIPAGATDIQFTLKGAGGGGGREDSEGNQESGQNGHLVITSYATSGITLRIYVGGGGVEAPPDTTNGSPGGWGYIFGGTGGNGESGDCDDWGYGGAGGGGSSAILADSSGTVLAEAAGGPGGRSSDWYGNCAYTYGGAGGPGGGLDMPSAANLSGGGVGGYGGGAPSAGGNGQVTITFN